MASCGTYESASTAAFSRSSSITVTTCSFAPSCLVVRIAKSSTSSLPVPRSVAQRMVPIFSLTRVLLGKRCSTSVAHQRHHAENYRRGQHHQRRRDRPEQRKALMVTELDLREPHEKIGRRDEGAQQVHRLPGDRSARELGG